MSAYDDSIAIVFPVVWPEDITFKAQNPSEPHCTLLWLGKISEASFTKEQVESVIRRLNTKAPGDVKTIELELFGPNKKYLVTTLDPSSLNPIRDNFERVLAKIGAGNASEYKEYKPHVTLDEQLSVSFDDAKALIGDLPHTVKLDAPVLWWGDERTPAI